MSLFAVHSTPGALLPRSARLAAASTSTIDDLDGRETDETDHERALKIHMAHFPERFADIPNDELVQWARDNLNDEWTKHEADRNQIEEERKRWDAEKAANKAANLIQIRREIVRAWIKSEDAQWAMERVNWVAEKEQLEKDLRDELFWLEKMVRSSDGTVIYDRARVIEEEDPPWQRW